MMKTGQFIFSVSLCILLGYGCSSSRTQAVESTSTEFSATSAPTSESTTIEFEVIDFPKAQSHWLTAGAEGKLYLIYGQDHSLFVARSRDGGQTFSEPVLATGDRPVHVLPIERPAISVDQADRVGIAWLEMSPDFNGATVWYASSEDGGQTFKPGQLVATETEGEVAMVQVALDDAGNPVLAWLNGSELRYARSFDQGSTFSKTISSGDGSCECCQPQLVVTSERIHIGYRSLEPGSDKGDIRDIVMIHSDDGGQTFGPVTRVSDAHWYLPACPIAGPSLATHEGKFYLAWMDGRAEPPGTFSRGDIWLASSQDGGESFSPNIRINPDQTMHHTLPTVAIGPGGRIHLAWEAQASDTRETFLYYTTSDDGGQTFAVPQIIADNTDETHGNPGKAALVIDSLGHVALAWLDRQGVRIATWTDTK
jgi:hypothetical protein